MQGLGGDARPDPDSWFTWVCRYYRYLHPGENRDPCIDAATKMVMAPSGDVFAICGRHYDEEAGPNGLELIREL